MVIISCFSLTILVFLAGFFRRQTKWLPLPLLVVVAGVVISLLLPIIGPLWALKTSQVVHIPANIFGAITTPDFSKMLTDPRIFKDALTIGLLASLETLLCAEAIDKLNPLKRKTPLNRELMAQGVGNIVCGLVGALPMTAVIIRGAANVDAGGRTRLSAFTHGVFLLLAVAAIFRFIFSEQTPLCTKSKTSSIAKIHVFPLPIFNAVLISRR